MDHELKCVSSRVGKSFMCEIEGDCGGECGTTIRCHVSTPFCDTQEVEMSRCLSRFGNEGIILMMDLTIATLEDNDKTTMGESPA